MSGLHGSGQSHHTWGGGGAFVSLDGGAHVDMPGLGLLGCESPPLLSVPHRFYAGQRVVSNGLDWVGLDSPAKTVKSPRVAAYCSAATM